MDTLQTLAALYEATRALGVSRDLEALLDEILLRSEELVGFEHCALLLPEGGGLRVRRVRGPGSEALGRRLRLNEGLAGRAGLERRPIRGDDLAHDQRHVPGLPGARSCLVVPLLVRNELAGVLSVESTRPRAFSVEHERLLTILGTQAALALEASRSRERMEQRLRELDALYRISQLAAGQRDLDSVLAGMLAVAQDLLPAGQAAILLLEGPEGPLRLRAARGYGPGAGELVIGLGEGVTGRCAQTGDVQLVDDVAQHPDYIPGVPGAVSELAVPLLAEGRVIGVLNAESAERAAYGPEHLRTLSVIAQQAATVLRAAQLQEETRRLAITDPLTGLFNRRHFVRELDEHLRRVRRYGGRLAVVALDLDGLKPLNDRHGHAAGDHLLVAFGALLQDDSRASDVVCRYGGEEFCLLMPHTTAMAAAHHLGQLLQRWRTQVFEHQGRRLSGLSFTAGVCDSTRPGAGGEALLQAADQALLAAKREGRAQVRLVGP